MADKKVINPVGCGCDEYPECTHALYFYMGAKHAHAEGHIEDALQKWFADHLYDSVVRVDDIMEYIREFALFSSAPPAPAMCGNRLPTGTYCILAKGHEPPCSPDIGKHWKGMASERELRELVAKWRKGSQDKELIMVAGFSQTDMAAICADELERLLARTGKPPKPCGPSQPETETISDGFGSTWTKRCYCGGVNQIMRPGKIQCSSEGTPQHDSYKFPEASAPSGAHLTSAAPCDFVVNSADPLSGFGGLRCKLQKGHDGSHLVGMLAAGSAPVEASDRERLRDTIEEALWMNAQGKDYRAAPFSVRREILDVAMPLVDGAITAAYQQGFAEGVKSVKS